MTDESPTLTPRRVALVLAAAVLAVVLLALAYQARHAGRVYPGVRVGEVDLGGLGPEAALAALAAGDGLLPARITLRDPVDGRTWEVAAEDLGLSWIPERVVDEALAVGREGWNPLARLFHPLLFPLTRPAVAPRVDFDPERAAATLADLAPEVDVAPRDAGVEEREGRLVSVPAVLGRQLDVPASLRALASLAEAPAAGPLDLVVQPTAARVPGLENVVEAYNLVISGPLDVGWRQVARFTVPQELLAAWVRIEDLPNPAGDIVPTIVFDRAAMAEWVAERRPAMERPAVSARFGFDQTGQVTVLDPGQEGLTVDVAASVEALIDTAYNDVRVGELAVIETPAPVPPAVLDRLLDVTLIGRASTSIDGVPAGRLRNLVAVTAALHGAAVAPGEFFSFNGALGAVDEAAGFETRLMGLAGPDGVLSQACTTLLRSAWWAGLPVIERHAPASRQGWVEPPVGLDCAVEPAAERDLVVLNDSGGYLMFSVILDPARRLLTVGLYGPELARRVAVVGPEVNAVSPAAPARTIRVPGLPADTREQVAWAREGAEVRLERRVYEGERFVTGDRWQSRYAPAGDIVVVGTGP